MLSSGVVDVATHEDKDTSLLHSWTSSGEEGFLFLLLYFSRGSVRAVCTHLIFGERVEDRKDTHRAHDCF